MGAEAKRFIWLLVGLFFVLSGTLAPAHAASHLDELDAPEHCLLCHVGDRDNDLLTPQTFDTPRGTKPRPAQSQPAVAARQHVHGRSSIRAPPGQLSLSILV